MELEKALQAGNIVATNGLVGIIMSNNKVYYNNGKADLVRDFEGNLDVYEEFYVYKLKEDVVVNIKLMLEGGVEHIKNHLECFYKVFEHKKLTLENIEYNKEYRAKDKCNNDLIIKKINMMERDYIISLICNDGIYLDEYIERIDRWTDIKNIKEIEVGV